MKYLKSFNEALESIKLSKDEMIKLSKKIYNDYNSHFKQIANMNVEHEGPLYIRSFATKWLKERDQKMEREDKKKLDKMLCDLLKKDN